MSQILVTGATGQLGRQVVHQLRSRAHQVRVTARRLDEVAGFPRYGFDVVYLDYDLPASWERALVDVDQVLCIPPSVDHIADRRVAPFLARCVRAGVQRIVLVSVAGAGRPAERAAAALDRTLRKHDVSWTILRPNWFLQNLTTGFIGRTARVHGVVPFPMATGPIAWVDVRDVAAVALRVLERRDLDGHVLALNGPHAVSLADIGARLARASGVVVPVRPVRPEVMRLGMVDADWPPERVDLLLSRFAAVEEGRYAATRGPLADLLDAPPRTVDAFLHAHPDAWTTGASIPTPLFDEA